MILNNCTIAKWVNISYKIFILKLTGRRLVIEIRPLLLFFLLFIHDYKIQLWLISDSSIRIIFVKGGSKFLLYIYYNTSNCCSCLLVQTCFNVKLHKRCLESYVDTFILLLIKTWWCKHFLWVKTFCVRLLWVCMR